MNNPSQDDYYGINDLVNMTKPAFRETSNDTGCTCYHETSCEIISNTEIAKAAIQQLLVAERIDELKTLTHNTVVPVYVSESIMKEYLNNRIAALKSQLTNSNND